MADVILNPRRVPRAPARCEARCLLPGGAFWASDTADVGPLGCQLPAPGPLQKGAPVKLVLTSERVAGELAATGRVAWSSREQPWRVGVTFDEPSSPSTARWFEALLAAYPELAVFQRAPAELDAGDLLHPGPPPRHDPALGPEEAAVLRAVGAGATVEKVRDLLARDWPAAETVLFAMLGKGHLTLDASAAGSPEAWARWLAARA